jgi:hypothetical protein
MLSRPAVSVGHRRISLTHGYQHAHCQFFKPLFSFGTLSPPRRLGIQRRPSSLLSDRGLTHHVTLSSFRTVARPKTARPQPAVTEPATASPPNQPNEMTKTVFVPGQHSLRARPSTDRLVTLRVDARIGAAGNMASWKPGRGKG